MKEEASWRKIRVKDTRIGGWMTVDDGGQCRSESEDMKPRKIDVATAFWFVLVLYV